MAQEEEVAAARWLLGQVNCKQRYRFPYMVPAIRAYRVLCREEVAAAKGKLGLPESPAFSPMVEP